MVGTSAGPQAAGTALLAVAGSAAAAASAVAAGAAMIDMGSADQAEVAAFRASHPGVPVCAAGDDADIVRDLATALRTGALLICTDPAAARSAGIPAGRLLAEVRPAGLRHAVAAGYPALVDLLDGPGQPDGPAQPAAPSQEAPAEAGAAAGAAALAIAAVSAWLGVAAVRTHHPRPVRRALDMAESVRGTRPPARTVRGLA